MQAASAAKKPRRVECAAEDNLGAPAPASPAICEMGPLPAGSNSTWVCIRSHRRPEEALKTYEPLRASLVLGEQLFCFVASEEMSEYATVFGDASPFLKATSIFNLGCLLMGALGDVSWVMRKVSKEIRPNCYTIRLAGKELQGKWTPC